jgi:hypothetical protein
VGGTAGATVAVGDNVGVAVGWGAQLDTNMLNAFRTISMAMEVRLFLVIIAFTLQFIRHWRMKN